MQLTKQQKVYATVLGLAVAAFGFDRWVLGPGAEGPEDAAVAPAGKRPAPRRAPRAVAAAALNTAAPGGAVVASASMAASTPSTAALAARLQSASKGLDLDRVADAFKPSASWTGLHRAAAPVVDSGDPVADFKARHKLSAAMKQGSGGVAIVDGQPLAVGQKLGGFRLSAVKDGSAIFRRGNLRVELHLGKEEAAGHMASVSAVQQPTSEKTAGTDPRE